MARTSTARGDQVTCCALDVKEEILRRRLLLRIGCLSDANGDGALLESKAGRRDGDASCFFGLAVAALFGVSSFCVFREINLGIEVRGGVLGTIPAGREGGGLSSGVFRMIVILPKSLLSIVL